MATTHSVIGASSYHRWKPCPGSVALCKDLPPRTSEYAELGTYFHEIASDVLLGKRDLALLELTENEEGMKAVKVFIDLIREEAKTATISKVEHGFDMSDLYPGLFGTCDALNYYADQKLLRVYDYKHGAGKFVQVEENEQLLYYALGAIWTLGLDVETVEIIICQPRIPRKNGPVHRWSTPMVPYMIEFAHALCTDAKRTETCQDILVTGGHCFFCPAVGFCPAQHSKRVEKAKDEFEEIT